jgi:hypothetical protein
VDPWLHIHAEVGGPLEFLRRHELDAHGFGTTGNGFLELEILRACDCNVPQLLQHCVQLEGLSPEGNHVQNKIDIFGSARILDRELDSLCAGNDKLFRRRPSAASNSSR